MIILLNGTEHDVPADATVAGVVAALQDIVDGRGVAVAVGGEVVPRTAWSQTRLAEGAKVEVVSAVQGG
ncbi:MAG TPA: sulfur carrier protein ThiS [Solirubrobacteraceae bacterium]|jgi:sulfur carrier protein